MQINQTNLSALLKGYRVQYCEAYQGGAPLWPSLAMETTSTAAEELYHWLGAVPGMTKMVGEATIKNLSAHKWAIANEEFEDTIAVKEADIERDTFGVYNPLFGAMGMAAAVHPDELVASLYLNGFTSKCYTGKNFFDDNHEPKAGKTKFSNKGTKKLSVANFQTARANLKSRLNAEGRPMNLGRDLVLIVSPDNEALGRQILISDLVAGGETNVNKGTARLVVWPQLAKSPNAWFLIEAGLPLKPMIMQFERKANNIIACNQPSDSHVLRFHTFLYQAYGRYNGGYGLPEFAYGSTGVDPA